MKRGCKLNISKIITRVFLSSCILILLSGCTNSEVRNTVNLIDSIGEVSYHSKSTIDEAQKAYDSLAPKYKEKVKNIDVLIEAQEAYEPYMEEYIFNTINLYRNSGIKNLWEFDNFVEQNYSRFSEVNIESLCSCLIEYKLEELAIPIVKENMKNPASFELISFNIDEIIKSTEDDSYYFAFITVEYRGTNSFGGIVPDTFEGALKLEVDLNYLSVDHIDTIIGSFV